MELDNRAVSSVVAVIIIIALVLFVGIIASNTVFDNTQKTRNTGEPSVSVQDTQNGRIITLVKKVELELSLSNLGTTRIISHAWEKQLQSPGLNKPLFSQIEIIEEN